MPLTSIEVIGEDFDEYGGATKVQLIYRGTTNNDVPFVSIATGVELEDVSDKVISDMTDNATEWEIEGLS